MNILVISHEFPPIGGGGATACRYLSEEFCKLGHTVTIVTSMLKGQAGSKIRGVAKVYRIKALRKKRDTSSFVEMLSFVGSAYLFTDKLCKREKFDVCLVFFGIPSGPVALRLKRKYGIPYVIRFGGGDIPGAQKRYKALYTVLNPITRAIWKNAKHLVANSEVLRYRALLFDDTNEISIICNGVDSGYYCRKQPYSCDGDIKFLFVSRLIEGKGLQYIIPHIKEINDRAGRRVVLTIVGDGLYRQMLENLVSDDIREYVIFAGRREGDELLQYYEDSTIFILPSLSEGMPNVVLEAMSMKLPIIMTDCGGSRELIEDNGRIVKLDSFMDIILEMCGDNIRLTQYSNESRIRAEKYFSWSAKAEQYIKLFQ